MFFSPSIPLSLSLLTITHLSPESSQPGCHPVRSLAIRTNLSMAAELSSNLVSLGDDLHLLEDDHNEPLVSVLLANLFPEVLSDLNDSEEDELVSLDQGVEVASQEGKTDCDATIIEEQAIPGREKEIREHRHKAGADLSWPLPWIGL